MNKSSSTSLSDNSNVSCLSLPAFSLQAVFSCLFICLVIFLLKSGMTYWVIVTEETDF